MEVRDLSGETYAAFEVKAAALETLASVLTKIALTCDPGWLLHSITMAADPESDEHFIYRVVLY